ncbi:PREDICTED: protein wings apart-like [Rhagoletis zephyria]|uniref:protein wings apart-like n=1 Tax=Rhagoletis zephyria TaxID=28612 RepID=UPI00081159BB|nr:PREDICTED: protein wings apart-like [Rhagoletis zephyria]
MSRWGKNIVVPLDVLCKGEENTNRPTVARSVGTVGKWGKIGFTSTRTYALAALSPAVAAAAAAAAAAVSPAQSPASLLDDDMSPSVPEPPKPKKFFKSRNTAPPEVIAQIIQNMPRTPASPARENYSAGTSNTGSLSTPVREPIKLKIPKAHSSERKKKSPKKSSAKQTAALSDGNVNEAATSTKPVSETKQKKKKEEKKLKPEAPPSRIISRARKVVNYCEDDEDERIPTPLKDIIFPKIKPAVAEESAVSIPDEGKKEVAVVEPDLPPPATPAPTSAAISSISIGSATATTAAVAPILAPKTPEHPPIVLRISKGTSRLVSTDSEEQPASNNVASPRQQLDTELSKSRHASTEEVPPIHLPTAYNTPKIIVKPLRPPSPDPVLPPPPLPAPHTASVSLAPQHHNAEDPPEINYSTVKISPDKPPKERLKLIIKTDVIRNAIKAAEAAKAAAAAQKAAAAAESGSIPGSEREKKSKSKKHKHLKHAALEQLSNSLQANIATTGSEFKTPSPHLAFNAHLEPQQQSALFGRTVISPPALSERDFDSQSSVLGSISSKGNSTPQLLTQIAQEESCVIHSRGSSVITSDLETSQHSSLVAPPSDIESRLESMMMDGEVSQRATNLVEEPLQEDILAVLRGDESLQSTVPPNKETNEQKVNGEMEQEQMDVSDKNTENQREEVNETEQETTENRRVTRGRGRGAKANNVQEENITPSPQKIQPVTTARTRGRKTVIPSATAAIAEEPNTSTTTTNKRATRGRPKKVLPTSEVSTPPSTEPDESPVKGSKELAKVPITEFATNQTSDSIETPAIAAAPVTRRGRPPRNISINNNVSSTINNINKIAANLSAKAGAAEEAAAAATRSGAASTSPLTASTPPAARSYGRKRKNQQVTQVLQPSAEELEEQQTGPPIKLANIDYTDTAADSDLNVCVSPQLTAQLQNTTLTPTLDLHDTNSNSNSLTRPASATPSSPPRRDYKVKDKFKRTLTLDNQANCNAVVESPTAGLLAEHVVYGVSNDAGSGPNGDEEPHRGSVKLVISKKKGSIFKSRALVPQDQTDQSAASKRHLYKHSWDAEANGNTVDNTNTLQLQKNESVVQPAVTRTAADAIFDDFSEGLSPGGISSENSPALGKLTRVTKGNNAQIRANSPYEMDIDAPGDSVTSVKVDRKAKGFYTVVRNVKTAHQIQEIGEYQEMDDDVEYILDALQPHNPTPTRCLSALQLASKCMIPTFRMHVRAHGVVTKFFKALSDANLDQSLGLCTSAIMFILSQEGLNMDLDRDSLELMMNLLESEIVAAPSDRANYERNRQKVRELCEEIKSQGKASHLNVDTLTVGTLAMETLLSLTSKRAGDWFKEELRSLGGLEHIIKTISDNCRPVIDCSNGATHIHWTQSLLDNMQTVERCMRVLENVTQLNEENQRYVLTYSQGAAVHTLCSLFTLCDREIMRHVSDSSEQTAKDSPGVVMRELLFPLLKVLINLTHTFNPAKALGAETLGQRKSVIETSFRLLLQAPNYIPERCVFELSILVLLLLINLTMYTIPNRVAIMKVNAPPEYSSHQHNKVTAVQAVMEYFYKCEELARLVEKNTDAILDSTDKNKKKQEEVDETVNNLLKNSGHHMEHTIKGSYAALLIGHLITDNEEYEALVRRNLRGNAFKEIVSVLEKYYTFMDLTCSEASAVAHIKSTKKLIDYFKKRDLVHEMNQSDDCALPLNLETHHASTSAANANANIGLMGNGDSPTMTTTRSGTQRVYKSYSLR